MEYTQGVFATTGKHTMFFNNNLQKSHFAFFCNYWIWGFFLIDFSGMKQIENSIKVSCRDNTVPIAQGYSMGPCMGSMVAQLLAPLPCWGPGFKSN